MSHEMISSAPEYTPVSGGHMNYQRMIARYADESKRFIKHHDDQAFTDPVRARHSRAYLTKELAAYHQLAAHGFAHIPAEVELTDGTTLSMSAHDGADGWHWRAPHDPSLRHQYISETLAALSDLETVPLAELSLEHPDINDSHGVLHHEGWGGFPERSAGISQMLLMSPIAGSSELAEALDKLYTLYISLPAQPPTVLAHHDLRQSNLSWHPDHGVRIVDWSWAGPGVPHADSTSFLIDVAKAGIDITPYIGYFNHEHALKLIGFWLEHATWPTFSGDRTVRDHQIASAVTAYRCLLDI